MQVLTQGVTHFLRSNGLDLLIKLAVLVTLLVVSDLIFQAIGSSRDAQRFPPPGELVNAGGHRLHIYCMGEGTPAVVMDSGFPASSLSWTFVQPAVARFTHTCSYDRAGLGWSDAGPMPRSSRQIVEELRALLLNAGVEGPFVLVGHSFGTFTVRLFASTYPGDVVGLVLVDPIHPSAWLQMTDASAKKLAGAIRLSRYGALLA